MGAHDGALLPMCATFSHVTYITRCACLSPSTGRPHEGLQGASGHRPSLRHPSSWIIEAAGWQFWGVGGLSGLPTILAVVHTLCLEREKKKQKQKETKGSAKEKEGKKKRASSPIKGEEGRGQGVQGEEGARRGAAVFVSCRCRSSPSSSTTASSPAAPAAPTAMEAEEHPPVGDGSNEGFVNLIVGVPKHMWGMIPEADRKNLVRRMAQKALKSFWKECALLPPPVRLVVGHHHHPPLRQAPPAMCIAT